MDPSFLKNKVILIVDDYKVNTELVSFSVSDVGAIPLIANNGRECIEIVEKRKVDIILMDYHMPEMDGIEATKIIRSLPEGNKIIIIGISCTEKNSERDRFLKAGMNGVVDKLTLNCEKLIEVTLPFFYDSTRADIPLINENQKEIQNNDSISNDVNSIAVMDYEKTLREFDNDKDLLKDLLQDFIQNIHSQLALMKKALSIKDFSFIQRESHGIRGGAVNLNASLLAGTAKSLEMSCKQSADSQVISDLLDELTNNVDLVGKFINNKEL